jgi:hypothetical protein
LRALQWSLAEKLSDPSAVYHVMDTTLIPAIVRVRASRKGLLFCGQATFGRSTSKTEWVYGFKVALVVDPGGVITAFGLAAASSDERPIADALVASDPHEAYLADKGFTGVEWERRWLDLYGALVAATPYEDSRRAWPKADCRWASGKRQIIEGVICQLKDFLCGAPSGEDVGRAAGTPDGQGRSVYLRPASQRFARPATLSPGGPVDLTHCTSVVLGLTSLRPQPVEDTLSSTVAPPSGIASRCRLLEHLDTLTRGAWAELSGVESNDHTVRSHQPRCRGRRLLPSTGSPDAIHALLPSLYSRTFL